jgi:hypothetical protein
MKQCVAKTTHVMFPLRARAGFPVPAINLTNPLSC